MAGVMSWLVGWETTIVANGKIQVVTMASWHDPAHTHRHGYTWRYTSHNI